MALLQDPISQRDFSAGRIAKTAVATALMPNYSSHTLSSAVNSVSNAFNVDFSEIIGSGIVRKGKQDILQFTQRITDGQSQRVSSSGSDLKADGNNVLAQTFTPTAGQTTTFAISIKIRLTGASFGDFNVSLQATTAGKPNGTVINGNSWTLPAGFITSFSTFATVFPTNPGTILTVGTVYAIVLSYYPGDGSNDWMNWTYNSGAVYAGGVAYTSTDGGATWTGTTGALYFAQEIVDTTTVYNSAPIANFSFLSNNLKKNVVGFVINFANPFGALYYYDTSLDTWRLSNLFFNQNFSFSTFATSKVRLANLNGYVFEVNGVNVMHSSADFGATWTTYDCIFPYELSATQAWDATINYPKGALAFYGSSAYVNLIDNNFNHEPDSNPNDWQVLTPIIPSLIIVSGNRLLVGNINGGPFRTANSYPSRIYFSSLVDPSKTISSGDIITWNSDPVSGDYIDIDPDSGGQITGLVNTSSLTLVFKNNGMYRLNTIAKSVDAENIYNVGAVSQEAITSCQGLVYFYSGSGIYSTDSTFPQQISRIAVQDFVDAISDPNQVYSWSDEFNVYFSIGTVTIQSGPEDFRTYSNVVLKFSPRDQNWQVYYYNQYLAQTSQFGLPPAQLLATEYNGAIAYVNTNTINDDGKAISFEMETQELEFGDRSHTKDISDKIVVYTRNGNESSFSIKQNDEDFQSANMTLEKRINVGTNVNFEGQFFTFKWKGEALGSRPIFEGFALPKVTDLGVTLNQNN